MAKRKRSEGKATWPGRKQVFRVFDDTGAMERDTLCLAHETHSGMPLLEPVMRKGYRIGALPTLAEARDKAAEQLRQLPEPMRGLEKTKPFTVVVSDQLRHLAQEIDNSFDAASKTRPI